MSLLLFTVLRRNLPRQRSITGRNFTGSNLCHIINYHNIFFPVIGTYNNRDIQWKGERSAFDAQFSEKIRRKVEQKMCRWCFTNDLRRCPGVFDRWEIHRQYSEQTRMSDGDGMVRKNRLLFASAFVSMRGYQFRYVFNFIALSFCNFPSVCVYWVANSLVYSKGRNPEKRVLLALFSCFSVFQGWCTCWNVTVFCFSFHLALLAWT